MKETMHHAVPLRKLISRAPCVEVIVLAAAAQVRFQFQGLTEVSENSGPTFCICEKHEDGYG